MATWRALIRRRSGEVLKIARPNVKGLLQGFADADPTMFITRTDDDGLSLVDGFDVRERLPNGDLGSMRQLGFGKILVGNEIRNASQGELNGFGAEEQLDDDELDARQTKTLMTGHGQFRRFAALIFKALNRTRTDAGLTPWTRQEIADFIEANVVKED